MGSKIMTNNNRRSGKGMDGFGYMAVLEMREEFGEEVGVLMEGGKGGGGRRILSPTRRFRGLLRSTMNG